MSSFDEVEKHNTIDRDHYRGLIARLKKARAEFLKAISELGE